MGITDKTLKRLLPRIEKGKSILVIGCQNIYTAENNGGLAHPYLESLGLDVTTIDITGCQGADVIDLREQYDWYKHDIVLDAGSLEHVDGNYYQAHKNIHDATKVGGIIMHENPKTGHWIGHGQNYVDMDFYRLLAEYAGYEILELCEEYAMGNITNGCNISVVMRKLIDAPFISEESFNKIGHVYPS